MSYADDPPANRSPTADDPSNFTHVARSHAPVPESPDDASPILRLPRAKQQEAAWRASESDLSVASGVISVPLRSGKVLRAN